YLFDASAHHLDLHSFPTRRSSDLLNRYFGDGEKCWRDDSFPNRRKSWLRAASPRRPGALVPALSCPRRRRSTRSSRATLRATSRSEEHTSELQSLAYLVCRLLLEK